MGRKQRLTLELAPPLPWGGGARCLFERVVWDRLRRDVYRHSRYRCRVCGQGGKMYCDAIWEFDERCGVIRIGCFIALCQLCHLCWHLDIAAAAEGAGDLTVGALAEHYCRVNHCTADAWQPAVDAAYERAARRADLPWYVDLKEYVEILPDATLAEIADVLVRSERDGDDTAGQSDATSEPAADKAQRDGDRGAGKRGKRKKARRRKPRGKGAR